jgi:hypothetical protein
MRSPLRAVMRAAAPSVVRAARARATAGGQSFAAGTMVLLASGQDGADLGPEGWREGSGRRHQDRAGRRGAFNQAKRDSGIPTSSSPDRVLPKIDRRGNIQPGSVYKWDLPTEGGARIARIRDDVGGHIYPNDPTESRGSHFNTENGDHYDY